jgi:hypothetical protein
MKPLTHPSQATLALYAGLDLGPLARWRTARHLAGCPRCRGEVAEFSDLRQEIAGLASLPGISWNRLSSEMKANIRVGLAAGECIRETRTISLPLFAGARAAIACASVAVLLMAGTWLLRPVPGSIAERPAGISVQFTDNGVEVRDGEQAFVLKNPRLKPEDRQSLTYTAGAQGAIGVRYVDPSTGYVTINTVYVQ